MADDDSTPESTPEPKPAEGITTSAEDNNFAGHFVHSLGHAVIQGPIDGVREIVNSIASKECIPKVQIVEPPKKVEFGSPAWQGQQFGKGAGTFAMLMMIGRLIRFR